MTRCNSCESIEPKAREATNGELLAMGFSCEEIQLGAEVQICAECECLEDTLEHYDEDYGSDR